MSFLHWNMCQYEPMFTDNSKQCCISWALFHAAQEPPAEQTICKLLHFHAAFTETAMAASAVHFSFSFSLTLIKNPQRNRWKSIRVTVVVHWETSVPPPILFPPLHSQMLEAVGCTSTIQFVHCHSTDTNTRKLNPHKDLVSEGFA